MPSRIRRLLEQGKLSRGALPDWLESNLHLEVILGSRAYGCNDPDSSDYDMRGFFLPPKVMPFPASQGLVVGYDTLPACDHWAQTQGLVDTQGNHYDFDLHNICKFFRLAQQNNPNQLDLLYAPETCITHCSAVGRMVLDNRQLFLSKLCWKRFRGYASDQFHYVRNRKPTGKRRELVEKYGFDCKFAYHCLRLLRECEQILTEGHLDLTQGNEEYKAIRRGEWSYETFEKEFLARKNAIEQFYHSDRCRLPEVPDHDRIRQLLLDCLEQHYGSLGAAVVRPDATLRALRDIDSVLGRVRGLL